MSKKKHEEEVEKSPLQEEIDFQIINSPNSPAPSLSASVVVKVPNSQSQLYSSNSAAQTHNETKTFIKANKSINAKCVNNLCFSQKHFKYKEYNFADVKKSVLHFCRRQQQILFPFFWGILVGVTLTTVLFQQGLIYSSPGSWNKDNILYAGSQHKQITSENKNLIFATRQMAISDRSNDEDAADKLSVNMVRCRTTYFVTMSCR